MGANQPLVQQVQPQTSELFAELTDDEVILQDLNKTLDMMANPTPPWDLALFKSLLRLLYEGGKAGYQNIARKDAEMDAK